MIIRDAETGLSLGAGRPASASIVAAGPFDEDSRLGLICDVEPGRPASQVSWWQLTSVTSIPAKQKATSTLSGQQYIKSLEQQQQQQQPAPTSTTSTITGNSLANVDYLTTISVDNEGGEMNLFLGMHSRPLKAADDWLAWQVWQAIVGAGGQYKLKHWTRVKDVSLSIGDKNIQATLQLSPLSRSYQGAEFLCLANNNQLGPPVNSTVSFNMNRE